LLDKTTKNIDKNFPLLDKLAQLDGFTKILGKRAKAKYLTNAYTYRLSGLKSDLKRSYQNTFYNCSNKLEQKDEKITGKYCNNRWCIVCNRIRTAKLINGYKSQLDDLPEKYFVTLTIPNVTGNDLRQVIQKMIQTFAKISRVYRDKRKTFIGIRKTECTYNAELNNFHPHFHLIISGEEQAYRLESDWLKQYPEAEKWCQNVKPADNNSVMELFKYFSKIVTNKTIYVSALDTIFRAIYGMRTYQAFGIKKNVSEDIEEIQAEIYKDLENRETTWTWLENDWIDKDSGEMLTGYTPDDSMKKLISSIK